MTIIYKNCRFYWVITLIIAIVSVAAPTSLDDTMDTVISQVLTSRIPPYSGSDGKCHLLIYGFSTYELNLPHLLENTLTTEIHPTMNRYSEGNHYFKKSFSCLHILLLSVDVEEQNRKWLRTLLRNVKQLAVHFIFLVDEPQAMEYLRASGVQYMKYRTFVSMDTGKIITEDRVGQVQALDRPTPLPSEGDIARNTKMSVIFWKLEPFITYDIDKNIIGGYAYNQATALCNYYNITCTYIPLYEPLSQLPNGTWLGAMYHMTDGDGEAFITGVTSSRYQAVDFTSGLFTFDVNFYCSHPSVTVKWQAVVYPFDLVVWFAIAGVWLICIPAFYLHLHSDFDRRVDEYSSTDPIYHSVIFPWAIMLQQGVKIASRAKFLTVSLMFYSTIVYTCYNSNLISFLTLPASDPIPTNYHQLAAASKSWKIILTSLSGTIQNLAFQNVTSPDLITVSRAIVHEKNWLTCAIEAATKPRTACIAVPFNVNRLAAENLTIHNTWFPLVKSKTSAVSYPAAAAVKFESRYYTLWNSNTGIFRDTGHFTKWTEDGYNVIYQRTIPWKRKQIQEGSPLMRKLIAVMKERDTTVLKPFTVKNVVVCFGCLGCGVWFAVLSFLVEVGCHALASEKVASFTRHLTKHSFVLAVHSARFLIRLSKKKKRKYSRKA